MSAHTSGPWCVGTDTARGQPFGRVHILAPSADGGPLQKVAVAMWEADAPLIAAAPAMLAKLEQLAAECAECHGTGYAVLPFSGGVPSRARCPDCADIRSVIAQAVGT